MTDYLNDQLLAWLALAAMLLGVAWVWWRFARWR